MRRQQTRPRSWRSPAPRESTRWLPPFGLAVMSSESLLRPWPEPLLGARLIESRGGTGVPRPWASPLTASRTPQVARPRALATRRVFRRAATTSKDPRPRERVDQAMPPRWRAPLDRHQPDRSPKHHRASLSRLRPPAAPRGPAGGWRRAGSAQGSEPCGFRVAKTAPASPGIAGVPAFELGSTSSLARGSRSVKVAPPPGVGV